MTEEEQARAINLLKKTRDALKGKVVNMAELLKEVDDLLKKLKVK